MDTNKKRTIIKAFVESQFSYCPLIWMLHSRGLNNKINCIRERALRITYNDKSSTFQELLDKDKSVSIHHRNIRVLATEIYKVSHWYSLAILNEVFVPSHCKYHFRKNNSLERRRISTVRHGTESLSFLGPKLWDIVPDYIKSPETMSAFQHKIEKYIPIESPCRICKIYLPWFRIIWITFKTRSQFKWK